VILISSASMTSDRSIVFLSVTAVYLPNCNHFCIRLMIFHMTKNSYAFLWNPMIHCSFHQSQILDPVLILVNPFDIAKPFSLSVFLIRSSLLCLMLQRHINRIKSSQFESRVIHLNSTKTSLSPYLNTIHSVWKRYSGILCKNS